MTALDRMRAYISTELARLRREVERQMPDDLTVQQRSALALAYTVEAQTLYFMELELDRIEKEA